MRVMFGLVSGTVAMLLASGAAAQRFDMGKAAAYTPTRGNGLEGTLPSPAAGGVQGTAPFFFSADVPEGNYRVTAVLGGVQASLTTVKAELRRLMLEQVAVPAGGRVTRSFIVNVRDPQIAGGGVVRLKAPRETTQEALAWDRRLTLEFNGKAPAVRAITIAPVQVPTVYLLGDSTVTDQSAEPYASWGQMLTAFFGPTVAVANHGESGESIASSNERRRFDKIMSVIRPGDTFIVQFGHNDMKEKAADPTAPSKYKAGLIAWVKAVHGKGAVPVLVTPTNRHSFRDGRVINSLEEYPEMVRQAAAETGAALIDLNASSAKLYEAIGEQPALALFKHEADGSGRDATHHSPYGAYELAKLVAQGLRDAGVPVAKALRADLPRFDPARPDALAAFTVPPSPGYTDQRPLGD